MSDAERIAARIDPEVLRRIADYLDSVRAPGQSELTLHHGPKGLVSAAQVWVRKARLDARPKQSASSRR